MPVCRISGEEFTVSEQEKALRQKFGLAGEPDLSPKSRFLQLAAFWQHWTLHKRKCERTHKDIISVFGPDCHYPVWHKDEWIKHADPPGADFVPGKAVFPQMWNFFQKSPIAHNVGAGNENCEYTDDCWYSKNSYLTHSLADCEGLRYCYRTVRCRDCLYTVFSTDCQMSTDLVACTNCFNVKYSLYSQQCRDSAFLFDCRNCSDCLFCWNLRNKQYCLFNQQLSKEEFEKKRSELDLRSRGVYRHAKNEFHKILKERIWLKALQIVNCENSTGDQLESCKDCENCFFLTHEVRDCVNTMRAHQVKDCLDCISSIRSELVYYSSCAQDQCYDVRFGYNLIQCRFAEYSAHCFQCEHIFGCCGLMGKKYYIFNKSYAPAEYEKKKKEIIEAMKKSGEYGQFFPGYFCANPYGESLANFHWPLDAEGLKKWGFWSVTADRKPEASYLPADSVPDHCEQADDTLFDKIFWDDQTKRPFHIQKADLDLSRKLGVPLPWSYYARRTQENFKFMPFSGSTRSAECAKCHQPIQTSWPVEYGARIICEKCYEKEVLG